MNKNKIICIVVIILILVFAIYIVLENEAKEIILNKGNDNNDIDINMSGENFSGEILQGTNYNIYVYDDMIVFYGEDNTTIVYTFDDDRLYNVQYAITTSSTDEANELKEIYEAQNLITNEFESIVVNGNVLLLNYNMDIFDEYKDYTAEEIKNILLEDAKNIN